MVDVNSLSQVAPDDVNGDSPSKSAMCSMKQILLAVLAAAVVGGAVAAGVVLGEKDTSSPYDSVKLPANWQNISADSLKTSNRNLQGPKLQQCEDCDELEGLVKKAILFF